MISNNRLGWFARSLTAAALSLPLVGACGDDGGVVVAPDGAPDADNVCTGHICPPPGVPVYTLPESGIMRTELFHVGNNPDGSRAEALGSWFFVFDGQSPVARGILGPTVDDIGATDVACFDNTAHDLLVNGYSDENQAIVDTRNYFDVGPSVAITPQGGGEPIEMARNENAPDPTNQLVHDVIYLSDLSAAGALQRNVAYDLPVLPPNETTGFAGLDLYAGLDIPGGVDFTQRTPSLYMPANFTMVNPTETDYYAADGLVVDSANDLVMEWTNGETPPADAPVVAQFTAFASVDGNGRPTIEYICVSPAAAGTHTIPSALFSKPGFPTAGLMLHGQLQHVVWAARNVAPGNGIDPENPDDGNFHFFGVNCNLNLTGGYSLSP